MNQRLRNLHRSMGAIVALFVLLLASTGILLNHTVDLELDKRHITWPWLLEHYGMTEIEADVAYLLGDNVISQFGDQVFVDADPIVQSHKPIIGGVVLEEITVLATDDALILLSPDGEFIERMAASAGVPSQIQNIGLFHGETVVQTRNGMWRSDYMLEDWENISLQGVSWSETSLVPDSIQQKLTRYFHGEGISVERFILDLHNGHILNSFGVWLLDILAIFLIILSLSGLWIWSKRSY